MPQRSCVRSGLFYLYRSHYIRPEMRSESAETQQRGPLTGSVRVRTWGAAQALDKNASRPSFVPTSTTLCSRFINHISTPMSDFYVSSSPSDSTSSAPPSLAHTFPLRPVPLLCAGHRCKGTAYFGVQLRRRWCVLVVVHTRYTSLPSSGVILQTR